MTLRNNTTGAPSLDQIWQRIKHATDRCDDQLRLMTVTTIDEDGDPDARLMVLRGASSSMKRFWFYSMHNSTKAKQIRQRPAVCVVGYDPREIVQIVARGKARVCVDDALTDDHWAQFQMAALNIMNQTSDSKPCCRNDDPWLTSVIRSLEGDPQEMCREQFALIDVQVVSFEWISIDGPKINRRVYDVSAPEK